MSSMHLFPVRRWLLQSPPVEWAILQLRALLIGALRQGPMPQHVAFVMDGNRRFARSRGIETVEGHNLGFEALARILEICYKSGIKHITIYSFSIENFKRSKHEVDALMDMAKTKMVQLTQHGELLERYGARVRVLGRRDLLRPDLVEVIERAEAMTQHNGGDAVLNVCFPYTSSDEITTAVRDTVVAFARPLPRGEGEREHGNRGFSERHIKQNIRARHIAGGAGAGASSTRKSTGASSTGTSLATILEHNPHLREASPSSAASPSSSSDSESSSSSSSSSSTTATTQPSDAHSSPQTPSQSHTPTTTASSTNLASATPEGKHHPSYPNPETITADTLSAHMFTHASPPLDLLIRTSGVERLSDFMLWQCHEHTRVVFLTCLWPDFDLWQFLPVLVEWQWGRRKREKEEGRVGRWVVA